MFRNIVIIMFFILMGALFGAGITLYSYPSDHNYDRVAMDRLMTDLQFQPSFYIDAGE